jgi:hypothetical protein
MSLLQPSSQDLLKEGVNSITQIKSKNLFITEVFWFLGMLK